MRECFKFNSQVSCDFVWFLCNILKYGRVKAFIPIRLDLRLDIVETSLKLLNYSLWKGFKGVLDSSCKQTWKLLRMLCAYLFKDWESGHRQRRTDDQNLQFSWAINVGIIYKSICVSCQWKLENFTNWEISQQDKRHIAVSHDKYFFNNSQHRVPKSISKYNMQTKAQ